MTGLILDEPVRFRNAAGGTAAAANPPPVTDPTQQQQRTANAPPRASATITAERMGLIAEADQLQTRSREGVLTAEEETRWDFVLGEAERLAGELTRSQREERLAHQRNLNQTPVRPAPAPPGPVNPGHSSRSAANNGTAEGLRLWMRSFTDEADNSADSRYRAQQAGFNLGSSSVRMDVDYGGTLNLDKRRTLSKGGTGTGAEFMPKTYSGKITEYMTYFSKLIGIVDSEVTADGNDRTYFIVDDTSLISTYTTASGGTEIAPTIPDSDITTGSKIIKAFDITSGYHKLTKQSMRDSAVNLEDKVAKAIANSHARRLERDIILGTGTTMPDGLIAAATVFGGAAVDDFDINLFEDVYFSMPQQYRDQCIWLTSSSAMARMRRKLRDTMGRSLFTTAIENGAEILNLYGRPVVTSQYMPAFAANQKCVLFFNPMFYMMRLVQGQTMDVLKEKFYPNVAYAGGMSFGGGWLGPASAITCVQLDATPANGAGT